jgi:hypothetical protein
MITTAFKRMAGGILLPILVAATVALVVFFPRPEQVEAAYDRVASWLSPRRSPETDEIVTRDMMSQFRPPAGVNRLDRD